MKTAKVETPMIAPLGPTHASMSDQGKAHGEQHSIVLYLTVWGLLFILSACSYFVDYFKRPIGRLKPIVSMRTSVPSLE